MPSPKPKRCSRGGHPGCPPEWAHLNGEGVVDKTHSELTKAGLAVAKAKGKKLGNPQNLTEEGRERGTKHSAKIRFDRANARAEAIRPTLEVYWKEEPGQFSTQAKVSPVLNLLQSTRRNRYRNLAERLAEEK